MSKRAAVMLALFGSCAALCSNTAAQSLNFIQNAPNDHEYGLQTSIPGTFGAGEFTFEVWLRPDNTKPVGPVTHGTPQQLVNWCDSDAQPYSSGSWWWEGNFLLDGHNNNTFSDGTFSLQFYGGGRVRWDFGDGSSGGAGGIRAVQAWPATSGPSLLDGNWHQVTCVRRWTGASSALLELWVDGAQIASATSALRTNMRTAYWNSWTGFPSGQAGWFWGSEKQAAIGVLSQYEDYKGLVDEVRFWSRAKSTAELQTDWNGSIVGTENGLAGWYRFDEGSGTTTCNTLTSSNCVALINTQSSIWNAADAPAGGPPPPPPPDADHDGLADSVETNTGVYVSPMDTGTNPNDRDSDDDGVPDDAEIALGTDPNNALDFPVGFRLYPAGIAISAALVALVFASLRRHRRA